MLIDCESCPMRDVACRDCVVTVFLDAPRLRPVELDGVEQIALARLAEAGLVPPLRGTESPRVVAVGEHERDGSSSIARETA
ncbi:MAG TPA: hypothetical protein VGL26_07530 [Jatrophihabitans sp.]|jgi:hypothetical protein